jgi:hypothetical protein
LNLLDTLLTKPLHYSLNHYTELKVDDYYLNLLDWSKSNILAVALRQCVFLWNASTGATQKLLETGSPVIFVFGVLNAGTAQRSQRTSSLLSNRKPVEKKLGKKNPRLCRKLLPLFLFWLGARA